MYDNFISKISLVSYPTVFVMPGRPPSVVVLSYANPLYPARVALSTATLCPPPAGPQSHTATGCAKTCTGCSLVCALRPPGYSLRNSSWIAMTEALKMIRMRTVPTWPPGTTSEPGPPFPRSISPSTTATEYLIGKLFSSPTVTAKILPVPAFQPGIVFQPLCGVLCAAFEQQQAFATWISLSLVHSVLPPSDRDEVLLLHLHLLSDLPEHVVRSRPELYPAGSPHSLQRSVSLLTCIADALPQAAALLPAVPCALPGTHSGSRTKTAQVVSLTSRSPLTRCPGSSPPRARTSYGPFPAPSLTLIARKLAPLLHQVPAAPLLHQPHRIAQVQLLPGPHEEAALPISPGHQPYLAKVALAAAQLSLQLAIQVLVLAQPHPLLPALHPVLRRSVRPAHQVGSAVSSEHQYTGPVLQRPLSRQSLQSSTYCTVTNPNTITSSLYSCSVTFR